METKKTLAAEFFALRPERRRSVHFILCEHALEKWNVYVKSRNKIDYVETVTGSRQEVDRQLPFDSLSSSIQGLDSLGVAKKYQEPIVALQNDDLIFPENITFAYYAVYNLFRKYAMKEVVDDWLIVNQALSTEDHRQAWETLLTDAIQRVKS